MAKNNRSMKCYQVNGGTCRNKVSPLNDFRCSAGHPNSPSSSFTAVQKIARTPSGEGDFAREAVSSSASFFQSGKLPSHLLNVPIASFPEGKLYDNLEQMTLQVSSLIKKVNPLISNRLSLEVNSFDFNKDMQDADKVSSLLEVIIDALDEVAPPGSFAKYESFGDETFLIIEDAKASVD